MKRILTDLADALRFRTARRAGRPARFVAALLVLMVTWSGWLYPLRPDAIGAVSHPFTADVLFDNSWGGPTLAGAWFVHTLVAVGIQVVCLAAIRRLNAMHGRRPVHAV